MFEDNDPNDRPDDIGDVDQQFYAALTLLTLAALCAMVWAYLVLTVGVDGPPL